MALNVGCQNTGSQIQGDENSVALTAQQVFPSVSEPSTSPPPPPPPVETCEDCFVVLSAGEQAEFLALVAATFPIDFPDGDATLEELCDVKLRLKKIH